MRLSGKRLAAVQCVLLGLAASLPGAAQACPNEAARTGAGARLPDCRAYELVTPRDTNGTPPVGADSFVGIEQPKLFAAPPATASGYSLLYGIDNTALPGTDGGGMTNAYRAERGSSGWTSVLLGPGSRQSEAAPIGGFSADQTYQVFRVDGFEDRYSGTLALGGATDYLHAPDGTFHLVGEGTLPSSPDEDGNPNGHADELDSVVEWISTHGDHVIFSQGPDPLRLLPESPSEGVKAIYDRTSAGLRLVSLLPGGEAAPKNSSFEGASADGSTVLFRSGGALYARVSGSHTEEIGAGAVFGAGVSDDGRFVFFVEGNEGTGNLFRYDTDSETTATISDSGDSRFVNVSPDGSHAYFESPSLLDGANGVSAAPNIYVWDGGSLRFVATVAPVDLERLAPGIGTMGLTQWVSGSEGASSPARNGRVVAETSRITADGTVLAFESTANLTGLDPGGEVEIYRYDDSTRRLVCVSCARTFVPPAAGAAFADYGLVAIGNNSVLRNLSADGSTVFFQSDEPLLSSDVNDTTDVYEWHEGALSLISTGTSSAPSLLMGASADGSDVFFRTAEHLVAEAQQDGAQAIYDARVDGGFPPAPLSRTPCISSCEGERSGEVAEPEPASALFVPHRKAHRRKHCGRRRQVGHHRTKCLRRHRHARVRGGRG